MIRTATPADAPVIARIYAPFISDTIVTFEEVAVSAQEMEQRIRQVMASYPWLVYEEEGLVIGYAYGTQWRQRAAYRHTVETAIYLAPEALGRGVGRTLYQALLDDIRERDCHVAMGVIALPNPGSVALHEKLGFAKAAHFAEVGYKFGRWVDVGYWQRTL